MFGSQRRLEQRPRAAGKSAQAEILNAKPGRAIEHGDPLVPGNVELEWKLELLVRPAGEAEFPAEITARASAVPGGVAQGQFLTVLFDPDDHRSLVVDRQAGEDAYQTLRARAMEVTAERRRQGTSAAEILAQAPPSQDPVDLLTKLAKLHESGAVSDEEFESEKQRIMGGRGS